MLRNRRVTPADNRVADALDSPTGRSRSPQLRSAQAAAAALAPSVFPGEGFRSSLKEQMLREFGRPHMTVTADAGTHDGDLQPVSSVAVRTEHGEMLLADVETIDSERAAKAAHVLDQIAEHHRQRLHL